jgi:hypothetical protein
MPTAPKGVREPDPHETFRARHFGSTRKFRPYSGSKTRQYAGIFFL